MQGESMQDFWNSRYRERARIWSGNPNPQLVAVAQDLPPGRALDVGCGEGADAVWLASRRWDVLGIDISEVALSRARAHGQQLEPSMSARLEWRQADLLASPELPGGFDLVSVQFMHLPDPERSRLFSSLTPLVGVGGTLLIVAHDPSDLATGARRPPDPDLFHTPQEIAGLLDDAWEIRMCAALPRVERAAEGRDVTVHDAVLQAVRLS